MATNLVEAEKIFHRTFENDLDNELQNYTWSIK